MNPTREQIKQARTQAGLTQQAASDLVGVSIKTIQSWEGGWRNMPEPMWRLFNILLHHQRNVARALSGRVASLSDK
jgi:DNA-binding transcriptional regulator YiaG